MINAPITMVIHNACHLSQIEGGHFIYDGKLYVKSRVIEKDRMYNQDIYVCLDDEGHYHSQGKNLTLTREKQNLVGADGQIDSQLGDNLNLVVTPVTFEWKSK